MRSGGSFVACAAGALMMLAGPADAQRQFVSKDAIQLAQREHGSGGGRGGGGGGGGPAVAPSGGGGGGGGRVISGGGRSGGGDRIIRREDRGRYRAGDGGGPRPALRDGDVGRSVTRQGRTIRDGGGRRFSRSYIHRHGRRHTWGPGIYFWFYDGYYYGDCEWLRRRAIATGSRYWWRRYNQCRYWY